ncbi:MAG: hypothetical protein JWM78_1641 [Verrucomicrobiaceae bacterium]|nr:hypothetical protein [Verrucomicrobiaceae bacterium]
MSYTPVIGEHGHTLCNLTYISAGQDIHIAIAVEEAGSANDRKIHVLHISEG